MAMEAKSALVLLTGGVDSVTLLAWALEGFSCRALYLRTVEYENCELESAKAAAEAAKVKLDVIDISQTVATLVGEEAPIPFGCTLALSIAVAHATRLGIDTVMLGITADDVNKAQNRELTCDYIQKFEETLKISRSTLQILTPFIRKNNNEVCELGKKLAVDYSKTWSCNILQGKEHCGKCYSCTARRKAFAECSIQDLTIYIYEGEIRPLREIECTNSGICLIFC